MFSFTGTSVLGHLVFHCLPLLSNLIRRLKFRFDLGQRFASVTARSATLLVLLGL